MGWKNVVDDSVYISISTGGRVGRKSSSKCSKFFIVRAYTRTNVCKKYMTFFHRKPNALQIDTVSANGLLFPDYVCYNYKLILEMQNDVLVCSRQ